MDIAEALKQTKAGAIDINRTQGRGIAGECKLCRILETMSSAEADTIRHYVVVEHFGAPRLGRALRLAGYSIGDSTVGRHLAERHDQGSE